MEYERSVEEPIVEWWSQKPDCKILHEQIKSWFQQI